MAAPQVAGKCWAGWVGFAGGLGWLSIALKGNLWRLILWKDLLLGDFPVKTL